MKISPGYVINILLHVLILFTFLSVFFFLYISNVEGIVLNNEIKSLTTSQTKKLLDYLNEKLPEWGLELPRSTIKKIANNLIEESNNDIDFIKKNNKNLQTRAYIIIFSILVILICIIIYYKYYKKIRIGISDIIIENLIIFSFAGLIEFFFFTEIASNYIPVDADFAINVVLNRIEKDLNSVLLT